ncbi:MAG: hypothetical protein WC606_00375 [Candidatus Absconditabacterales bacterium]|jgi:hypothetical protein
MKKLMIMLILVVATGLITNSVWSQSLVDINVKIDSLKNKLQEIRTSIEQPVVELKNLEETKKTLELLLAIQELKENEVITVTDPCVGVKIYYHPSVEYLTLNIALSVPDWDFETSRNIWKKEQYSQKYVNGIFQTRKGGVADIEILDQRGKKMTIKKEFSLNIQ